MKKLTAICVAAALVLAVNGLAQADTHYVDLVGTNTSPYNTPGTAAHSVQDAIDAAAPGDTIQVAAGTYNEGDIVVDKQLTIQGAGSASTIIDASGASTDYGILLTAGGTSAAQRLTIRGLTIKNSPSHGIKAYKAGGINLDHVTLEDLILTLNGSRGMEIHNDVAVSDMEITNCQMVNNVKQGLRTASNVAVDGMDMTDSDFSENSYGIYLQGTINGVTILRSTFNNSVGGYGGYMTETGPLTNFVIEDSEFNNNVVGLMVWNVQNNADITITGTTFQGNGAWGVLIWGNTLTDVLIQDCSVLNNDGLGGGYYGIDFAADDGSWTYLGSMDNVAVHNTNITGHTVGGGVKNRNAVATAIVDATCNWWDDASGPYNLASNPTGTGDAVTDYVDYGPWLLSPAPDGLCGGYEQFARCFEDPPSHGYFVSCVAKALKDMMKAGYITGEEAGAIASWAAQADIPPSF
jgi:hypothetical protein